MTDLFKTKIFDQVIDGIEYQVIVPDDFYNILKQIGITIEDESEKEIIDKLLRLTSFDSKWYFIDSLNTILSSLGIREHIPADTKFLKYSSLRGREVRIMNRLVYFAERNNIKDIRKLFSSQIFTQKVVSTKQVDKEQFIDLMYSDEFLKVLKKYNISKGIELEENLLFLL